MDSCIFCKIVAKQIPANVVFEDERVMAFHDINPVAPVHVLIIPKEHIESVNHLNEQNAAVLKDIHLVAKEVAQKLGIVDKGYRLITNIGSDGGQVVHHLHYHLIGGKNLGSKIVK